MAKMIITVPRGYNAAKFMDIASELSRSRLGEDYDLNLGDYLTPRLSAGFDDEYELDIENVAEEQLDVIKDLQQICPEVKTIIQRDDEDTGYDIDTFAKIASLHRDELDRRESLDLFLPIVNQHHERTARRA